MFARIIAHLRANLFIYSLVFIVVVGNGWLAYTNFLSPRVHVPNPVVEKPSTDAPAGTVASSINGDYIPQANTSLRPVAFMIDNLSSARPAAGLSEAALIWEALTEGGVTRLMPIFQTNNETVIGPVRSARDYYLPWANEVEAIYGHSGGSRDGLAALKAHQEIPDADEFSNGSAYYRSPGTTPPHNLFTSTSRLQTLAQKKEWNKVPSITSLSVSDAAPNGTTSKTITVDFSTSPFKVVWTWDDAAKVYRRVQGGAIARDRNTGDQLNTKNVIVLAAQIDPAPDYALPGAPKIAVSIQSVGSGEAWFFRDGVMVHGKWSKTSFDSRIVFTTDDGKVYEIDRGQIWIEVIPKDKKDAIVFN